MQQPDRDQYFAEISASAARLAEIARTHDPDLPVPTCPDWTLRQLATHIGRVHRWAAHIVTTRAADYVPFNSVPDGRYPTGPAERAVWLLAGADRLIGAITDAGDTPVWAFGRQAPACFWARRQSHETMVHRADAELAVGCDVVLDADLAADGIDEWLQLLSYRPGKPPPTGTGETLHLHCTDRPGEWLLRRTPEDLQIEPTHAKGDVAVRGSGSDLLLVLLHRASPEAVEVLGARPVLDAFLAETAF